MDIEYYTNQRQLLLDHWLARHKKSREEFGFVQDGVICPDEWFSRDGQERILFVLKEAYEKSEKKHVWDLPCWIREERCMELENCKKECKGCFKAKNAYTRLAEWAWGIDEYKNYKRKEFDAWLGISSKKISEYNSARRKILYSTAIINIKKSDGLKTSNTQELLRYAEIDRDLLSKQISLINPTVIICGGTIEMLCTVFRDIPKLN